MKFILWTAVWFLLGSLNGLIVLYKYGVDAHRDYVNENAAGYVVVVILWIALYHAYIK